MRESPPTRERVNPVVNTLAVDAGITGGEVFEFLEMRDHIVGAPADIAELTPLIVVAVLAAHIDHAVDG
jgi:hypothetical protein